MGRAVVSAQFRSLAHQRQRVWKIYPQRAASDFRIGVMGLGEIGGYIATRLAGLGYHVSAGRAVRNPGVRCYHGDAQAGEFFAELDALINVLPLTEQTRGILARRCSIGFPQARYSSTAARRTYGESRYSAGAG
jgi:phosphoglycerate dehydrogenase-like enzyme